MSVTRILLLAAAFAGSLSAFSIDGGGSSEARLRVECTRSSAFVQVRLDHDRRIGKLVLEIRDRNGRVLYHEEGKALTEELVRRVDKGMLPRGTHTLTIVGKDLSLSQDFTVE